ncbi:MAG: SusD/RagB family nutrient-binding outer membrane lipoprotein [Prevotellaceae bacterium]|jgi:hypothetical protein|nr:SusD/RagB family nutrient-binding outer membrane lipoprotein [Prevotellaceae bacterium]
MKTIRFSIAVCLSTLIIGLTGCDEWLDVNNNVDAPTSVAAEQVLPVILFFAAQSCYDNAEYGAYLSQALTTGGRAQVSSYAYKNGWHFFTSSVNRHPQWRRHYYDIGTNNNAMQEAAEKEQYRNLMLIGRTLYLQSMLFTTDMFGDMPHTEAYTNFAPAYDSQASIYEWMMNEVDDLLKLYDDPAWINASTNKTLTVSSDRVFGGDLNKWRAFTKGLKARLLIRKLPNWDNTPATCNQIIQTVEDALTDPGWTDALYKFDGGPNEKSCQWGPLQPTCNIGWPQGRANLLHEAVPSTFFGQALLGFYPSWKQRSGYALDPRAIRMMTPRAIDGKKDVRGTGLFLDNNIGMPVTRKITDYPDLYSSGRPGTIDSLSLPVNSNPYTKNDGYIAMLTEEELLFIKAEAQYWANDKAGAYNTTVQATERNMQRYNIFPSALTTDEKNQYDWFFTVRLPGETEFTIGDLMQQKYVAMYLQPEQWTDVRRYNYSSKTNGIAYDGEFVYTVKRVHNGSTGAITANNLSTIFSAEFSLTRPYNLYEAYWLTDKDAGINARLSPNAWIMRINYDPETEEKYNRKELEKLGAFRNPDWLRKRMIWGYKNNGFVTVLDPTEWY